MSSGIHFNFNTSKSIAMILYIIKQCNGSVNKYNLLKMIFSADKYHLNKYARPVTGDYYMKMDYGTVPSNIYDILRNNNSDYYLNEINRDEFPFDGKKEGRGYFVVSENEPNFELFSQSDIEALDFGINEYKGLDFNEVKNKNHQEKCWLETDDNQKIDFEKMIDNKDIIKDLKESSYNIVI